MHGNGPGHATQLALVSSAASAAAAAAAAAADTGTQLRHPKLWG